MIGIEPAQTRRVVVDEHEVRYDGIGSAVIYEAVCNNDGVRWKEIVHQTQTMESDSSDLVIHPVLNQLNNMLRMQSDIHAVEPVSVRPQRSSCRVTLASFHPQSTSS
jgi:hypothetical protein